MKNHHVGDNALPGAIFLLPSGIETGRTKPTIIKIIQYHLDP
jgi:hypothetical protein